MESLRIMSPIEVRDARISDTDALAKLCTQLGYPTATTVMPSRLDRLATDENARALVAADGGEVVGLMTIHIRYTLNHEAPIAQLTMLVVDETTRSRGVGRALVDAGERWAREQGCKRIVVTTALDRDGAHAFYEKLAYKHTGRRYLKDFSP